MKEIKCNKCEQINKVPEDKENFYCSNCGNKIVGDNNEKKNNNSLPVIIVVAIIGLFIIGLLIFSSIKYGFNDDNGGGYFGGECDKISLDDILMKDVMIDKFNYRGYIEYNDNEELDITLCGVNKKVYNKLLKEFKNIGYTTLDDSAEDGVYSYNAFKDTDARLSLVYYPDEKNIWIYINKYKKIKDINWPTFGIVTNIPKPESTRGYITNDSSDYFGAVLLANSKDEYLKYVETLKAAGYINNYDYSENYYTADNANGYTITITYYSNNLYSIDLESPDYYDDEEDEEEIDSPVVVPNEVQ